MSKLTPLELAALQWWRFHRPIRWTQAQHIAEPTVNVTNERARRLAKQAAKVAGKKGMR